MVLKKTVAQGIQEYSDYKKQHEFFVVTPMIGFTPRPKPYKERLSGWLSMCEATHLDLKDYFVEGNGTAVLLFKNGLRLSDTGHRVSFSAIEDKEKVNMNSAMMVVRCSANHLCRQGWDLGVDFATIRYGAADMVQTFEKAHKEARQILNRERIALLTSKTKKVSY